MRKILLAPALALIVATVSADDQKTEDEVQVEVKSLEVLEVLGAMETINVTSDLPIDEEATVGDNVEIDEILAAADAAETESEIGPVETGEQEGEESVSDLEEEN